MCNNNKKQNSSDLMKEPVPVGGGGPETEISAVETFKTKMKKNPECRASAKGIRGWKPRNMEAI
jgi:hypothetical protein